MVEDNLDGEPPELRFRLSVARAGLRERGHLARMTTLAGILQLFLLL